MNYLRQARKLHRCAFEPCGAFTRGVYRGGSYEYVACCEEHAGLARLELETLPLAERQRLWGPTAK